MSPRLMVHRTPSSVYRHAELASESLVGHAVAHSDKSHLTNCLISQDGLDTLFTTRTAFFCPHISQIVSVCPREHVVEIHAARSVAAMTQLHPEGNFSSLCSPQYCQCTYVHSVEPHNRIVTTIGSAPPQVASIAANDLALYSFQQRRPGIDSPRHAESPFGVPTPPAAATARGQLVPLSLPEHGGAR
jgi:hypothetical protein